MNSVIDTIILLEYGTELSGELFPILKGRGYSLFCVDLATATMPSFGDIEAALIVAVSKAQSWAEQLSRRFVRAHTVLIDPTEGVRQSSGFKPVSVILTAGAVAPAVEYSAQKNYVESYPLPSAAVYRLGLFVAFLLRAAASDRPAASRCCCCRETADEKWVSSRNRQLEQSLERGLSFAGEWSFSQQAEAQRQYEGGFSPWFCVFCVTSVVLAAGVYGRPEYRCRQRANNGVTMANINLSPRFRSMTNVATADGSIFSEPESSFFNAGTT